MDLKLLRSSLHNWYHQHKRALPWRENNDPYAIWLSEIILQQTRVSQGLPYYQRFLERFPKVEDLANAPQTEVLKLWEGLGYYSRARNLQSAAQTLRDEYNGVFPKDYDKIRGLKGVGDYTAAAIASFAFDQAKAVVDGNVYRVLSRLSGDPTPINTTAGKKLFQALADDWLDPNQPALHNQAIMEFGALQCVPKNPDCKVCPLKDACEAFRLEKVGALPVKKKKKYDRQRYLNYLHISDVKGSWVENRDTGIWKGLWQFPLIEVNEELKWSQLKERLAPKLKNSLANEPRRYILAKHKLSHQSLYIQVWKFEQEIPALSDFFPAAQQVAESTLDELAFPRPLRKYLDENQLTLPLD